MVILGDCDKRRAYILRTADLHKIDILELLARCRSKPFYRE